MGLEQKVDAALAALLDEMEKLTPGSEDYNECVKAYTELQKAKTEYYKAQADDWNKRSELENNKLRCVLENAVKALGTISGGAITAWTIHKLTKYEDEIASVSSKALSFIPKLKIW